MPVFDGKRFLDEAVRSILAQSHRPLEWIAVDDGSSDASPAALSRLAAEAAAAGVEAHVLSTPRLGVAGARNAGIRQAHGEVLAFLDQDDVLEPDCLGRQVEMLLASPSRFVACDLAWLGRSPDGRETFPPRDHVPPTTYEDAWLRIGITTPGAVVVRRDDVLAAGGFPEDPAFAGADDRGLWLELVARGVLPVRNPFVGLRYRIHEAQASRGLRQKRAKLALFAAYARRTGGDPPGPLVSAPIAALKLASLHLDLATDLLDIDPAEADREAEAARTLAPAVDRTDLGRRFRAKRRRKAIGRLPLVGPLAKAVARLLSRRD